jgi:hypothetical protein
VNIAPPFPGPNGAAEPISEVEREDARPGEVPASGSGRGAKLGTPPLEGELAYFGLLAEQKPEKLEAQDRLLACMLTGGGKP